MYFFWTQIFSQQMSQRMFIYLHKNYASLWPMRTAENGIGLGKRYIYASCIHFVYFSLKRPNSMHGTVLFQTWFVKLTSTYVKLPSKYNIHKWRIIFAQRWMLLIENAIMRNISKTDCWGNFKRVSVDKLVAGLCLNRLLLI